MPFVQTGRTTGIDKPLITQIQMGHLAKSISNYAAAEIKGKYSNPRQMYEHRSHVVLVSFLVYFDEGI